VPGKQASVSSRACSVITVSAHDLKSVLTSLLVPISDSSSNSKVDTVSRMTSPLDPMDIARARIAWEAKWRTGSLDLSLLRLEVLPEELAGLTALQKLDCSNTQVTDLAPLAGLTALQTLDCSSTEVADLAPLAELTALQTLNCSRCPLRSLPAVIRDKPSLRKLMLFESHVPGIPREVLSQHYEENCLAAVRAHFADLAVEAAVLPDVRLLMIGNGRVGKTQIARWLAGDSFEEDWNSTHGIQVSGVPLPSDARTGLQIWDFGGQDIYHGTHALFLRNPAVLVVVWAEEEEKLAGYEHGGLMFRNHPLAYWIEMVRHLTDPHSPVLILQNKCDRPEQEVLPFPIPDTNSKELSCLSCGWNEPNRNE
jgi:internalin A